MSKSYESLRNKQVSEQVVLTVIWTAAVVIEASTTIVIV
jgi:hypothetical protein